MKKWLSIPLKIIAGILIVLLAALAALQAPVVQSWLGARLVDKFLGDIDADISFREVSLRPLEALALEDVVIKDRNPMLQGADTLISIGSFGARFSIVGLLNGTGAYLSHANLENSSFFLVLEPDSTGESSTNLDRVFRLTGSDADAPPSWGNLLNARNLVVNNFRFRMVNIIQDQDYIPGKMDFSNLDVLVDHLHARNISVADNFITGTVESLRAVEKSGFNIEELQARKVKVGMGRVSINNLDLLATDSEVHLKSLRLDGPLDDYTFFTDRIRISGEINPGTLISMHTISFFAPLEESMNFRGKLQGKVQGYVTDFLLRDVSLVDLDHNFNAQVSGRIMNCTDIQNCALDTKIKEAAFTMAGLGGFLKTWAPDLDAGFDSFAPGELFTFNGSAKGPLNRLDVDGDLSSRLGNAKAGITVRNTVDPKRPIIIGGGISTRNLDVGKIAGIDAIGPVTLNSGLEASIPKNGGIKVRIDSLKINRLSALGYDYTNISAAGDYAEDAFDGRIIAADPNLNFLFQGKFNLSKKTKNHVYRFYASLGYADLHALNIDKRPQSKISFQASSNFIRTEANDILGDVTVSNLTLVSASGTHNLGNLTVKAHANDNIHRINISSSYLDGSYLGDKSPIDFVSHLQNLTLDRNLSALDPTPAAQWDGSTYSINLKLKDSYELLDFLSPGAYAANPTELNLSINPDGLLSGSLQSGRLALKDKFIRDLQLAVNNDGDALKADLQGSTIQLPGGVKLLGSHLSVFAGDNHIGLGYSFDNSEEEDSKAEIYLNADLSRDADGLCVQARALPSNLYYKGDGWGISSGDITFKGGNLSVDALRARHDTELLEVNGGFSPTRADTLRVKMDKFNVGIVSNFIGNLLPIEGYASGDAVIISPSTPFPGVEAGIVCDSTMVSGQRMGSLAIMSNWDAASQRFNIGARSTLDGRNPLDIQGYMVPKSQTLSAEARLDRFNIASIHPILSSIFSTFDGYLDGVVKVDGPLSKLDIGSEGLKISDSHVALDFTRAVYDVEGEMALTRKALTLTELRLSDNSGGKATVKGDILLNNFQDMGTDLSITLDRIKALNLQRGENPTLWGSISASGGLTVKGPFNRIAVDINAATSGPGEIHLPIGGASGEIERKMLVFTEPPAQIQQDPYELLMAANANKENSESNLSVNLRARATPDVTVYIDLGENTLHARGSGNIGLNMETAQYDFALSGDYTLQEGSFRFSAMNLVSRDFTIQNGSSVRFNGPVNDTDLNVKGLYITKASLDNLMPSMTTDDNSSGGGRRTVNCGIDITGKLSNPELKFSIDVPDLNPSAQLALANAISTEDKIQKQFIYLLIAGSFLPDDDSGISSTGTDVLYSNVSSIMSGQINNIFQKLNIPLDLGLNYKATEGKNMFDVALSTQLFNNRVVVNGAVGNKQIIGRTTSEITGDIDVEIKLSKNGNFRTTIFSHSADQFSTYLDNSQRNGVGITYQKEFYSFSQLFSEMFMTKRQREEQAARRLSVSGMPQTTIQIDSTGKSKAMENDSER